MAGAFQKNAFQNNAFQVDGGGGGSGRKRRPLYPAEDTQSYPAKARKSVKPVWDRGAPVAPAVKVSAPQRVPTTPAAPVRNIVALKPKSAAPFILEQLLPPAPATKPPAKELSQTVAKRRITHPAVVSAALLEESDEGIASGAVSLVAHGLVDDQDLATSTAAVAIDAQVLLADVDDIGHGKTGVSILGDGIGSEDSDTLSAKASWDDDDIILSMIMHSRR